MIRRPPRSTHCISSAASDVYKRQEPIDPVELARMGHSAEARAQQGRASPTDTATSALGGCVVVSGEQVEGTRHVFDASLSTPEGDRSWSVNVVDLPSDMEEAWLVIGFTGEVSPTGRMVAGVAQLLKENPELETEMDAIATITRAGLTALSVAISMRSAWPWTHVTRNSDSSVSAARHWRRWWRLQDHTRWVPS